MPLKKETKLNQTKCLPVRNNNTANRLPGRPFVYQNEYGINCEWLGVCELVQNVQLNKNKKLNSS